MSILLKDVDEMMYIQEGLPAFTYVLGLECLESETNRWIKSEYGSTGQLWGITLTLSEILTRIL